MTSIAQNNESVNTPPDPICQRVSCPACGAAVGEKCRTIIDGIDMFWTHDARVYADMGVRHA